MILDYELPTNGLDVRNYARKRLAIPAVRLTGWLCPDLYASTKVLDALYMLEPASPAAIMAHLHEGQSPAKGRISGSFTRVRDQLYEAASEQTGGNLTEAGRILGVTRQAVQQHLGHSHKN